MSERERLVELLLESEPIKERDLDDGWGDNEISDIAEWDYANKDVAFEEAKKCLYEIIAEIGAQLLEATKGGATNE